MRSCVLIAFLAPCLVQSKLHAREPDHVQYLRWHHQCLSLDTSVIDQQITKLEKKLSKNRNDYLAKVYLGSAFALRAKASFWGPTKLKYLKRGQQHLNNAVRAAPNDPRVRMVRAIGYYKVPKIFKVRAIALTDFKTLLPIAKTSSSKLDLNERQAILYYAYLTFQEEGEADALNIKSICHQLSPNSKYGKLTK